MCPRKVRGIEVRRLFGDKVNLHNRMKENRLCGFLIYNNIKNYYWIIHIIWIFRIL